MTKSTIATATSVMRAPEVLEDFIVFRLHQLVRRATSGVEQVVCDAAGINRRAWRVMMAIDRAPDGTLTDLARSVGLDKAVTSRTVARLVTRGLVRYRRSDADARQAQLALTPEGRQAQALALEAARCWNHALAASLDDTALLSLERSLDTLQRQAQALVAAKASVIPPAPVEAGVDDAFWLGRAKDEPEQP